MTTTRSTRRSNDFTGRQAEQLAKEAMEEQKIRASELAMITAQEQEEFTNVVHDAVARPSDPQVIDEVIDTGNITLAEDVTIVRVAEDIENMTYGYGNTYNFKAGGRYKVPVAVADRLQELGLLYDRL